MSKRTHSPKTSSKVVADWQPKEGSTEATVKTPTSENFGKKYWFIKKSDGSGQFDYFQWSDPEMRAAALKKFKRTRPNPSSTSISTTSSSSGPTNLNTTNSILEVGEQVKLASKCITELTEACHALSALLVKHMEMLKEVDDDDDQLDGGKYVDSESDDDREVLM